jgi:hypothetical protein
LKWIPSQRSLSSIQKLCKRQRHLTIDVSFEIGSFMDMGLHKIPHW